MKELMISGFLLDLSGLSRRPCARIRLNVSPRASRGRIRSDRVIVSLFQL